MSTFDKKEIYDQKIAPLLQSLMQACGEEKLPVFITVAVKNDNKDTEYVTSMASSSVHSLDLENDRFPKLVNVMNGFDTVPHFDPIELEFN